MKDNLKKFYPSLTASERFNLALEAMVRDDEREMNRLADSCPWKTYRMKDAAFTDLVDTAHWAVDTFTILWLEASRRYQVAELGLIMHLGTIGWWMRGYVTGANNGWKTAGGEGVFFDIDGRDPTNEEMEEAGLAAVLENPPKDLESIFRDRASELKGVYEGFTRFCKAVDLDPEKLLRWYRPVLEDVKNSRDLLDGKIPTDQDTSDSIFEILYNNWP